MHNVKEKLKLDKPVYLGFSILDLSKWLMNDFHYSFIKNKYGNDAQLLFTDTDSLCYEIKTEDFYKDMYDNKDLFDSSDMKGTMEYSGFNDTANKKVIGKFKDETSGLPIKEFIGLRSKMYSVLLDNETEKKTAKGVVRSVVKKELSHATYKNILETSGKMYSNMKVIRSQKHQIFTMEMRKVSLSAFDNKYLKLGCPKPQSSNSCSKRHNNIFNCKKEIMKWHYWLSKCWFILPKIPNKNERNSGSVSHRKACNSSK